MVTRVPLDWALLGIFVLGMSGDCPARPQLVSALILSVRRSSTQVC